MVQSTATEQAIGRAETDPAGALEEVRTMARECRACPLWETGTQTVFGVGPATARLLFIGEAPGHGEDQQGIPFVGPAGQIFNAGLEQAGLQRDEVYVTNAVKHRPYRPGGRQGRNRPPKQSEVNACRPWLTAELAIVRPEIIVCLGAVAAKAVLGKDFRLTQQRGEWLMTETVPNALATLHPSYILKQPPESREAVRDQFNSDLRLAADRFRKLRSSPSNRPSSGAG